MLRHKNKLLPPVFIKNYAIHGFTHLSVQHKAHTECGKERGQERKKKKSTARNVLLALKLADDSDHDVDDEFTKRNGIGKGKGKSGDRNRLLLPDTSTSARSFSLLLVRTAVSFMRRTQRHLIYLFVVVGVRGAYCFAEVKCLLKPLEPHTRRVSRGAWNIAKYLYLLYWLALWLGQGLNCTWILDKAALLKRPSADVISQQQSINLLANSTLAATQSYYWSHSGSNQINLFPVRNNIQPKNHYPFSLIFALIKICNFFFSNSVSFRSRVTHINTHKLNCCCLRSHRNYKWQSIFIKYMQHRDDCRVCCLVSTNNNNNSTWYSASPRTLVVDKVDCMIVLAKDMLVSGRLLNLWLRHKRIYRYIFSLATHSMCRCCVLVSSLSVWLACPFAMNVRTTCDFSGRPCAVAGWVWG